MINVRCRHLVVSFLFAIATLSGCGVPPGSGTSEQTEPEPKGKIRAEAYLFDAQVRRYGRTTSFRLNIYQLDSLIAIGGRGYLGKGALKGWLRDDSIKVYFPITGEYLHESTGSLFSGLAAYICSDSLSGLSLMGFFKGLPELTAISAGYELEQIGKKEKRPRFKVTSPGCSWSAEFEYDQRKTGWRVREFKFSDGDGNWLRAKRREYKRNANVKLKHFHLSIPPSAVRINP